MKQLFPLLLLFLFGCSNLPDESFNKAVTSINADDLDKHLTIIASDEFQGRQPSTIGEERTINYLKDEFEKLGLKPGNKDSYFQPVPLVDIVTDVNKELVIKGNNKTTSLKFADEFVVTSSRLAQNVEIKNAELIFAGYGIVAPEYGWNDYEGIDVKDKIVVVMVNDPGYATKDPTLFTGNAMTYYGRWTYKYEEAARQGAAGCFIIHETGAAGYPWEVVRNGWTGPQYYLVSEDKNFSNCKMDGWINNQKAKEILAQAGYDFDEIMEKISKRGFKPFSLNLRTSLIMKNKIRESVSNNVVALLPGTERANEYVIYTAHWDHFGMDTTLDDDQIYNGARDNATGTAGLLEIAEAFTKLDIKPQRSVIFLAVTAEEQGLLGSKYYADNPIYPLEKTVAVINMDALNIFGKVKDITVIGYGNSELDKYVEAAAGRQNRIVKTDPEPQKGGFYRSDHFSFAKHGIPGVYAKGGVQNIEKGEEWMRQEVAKWTSEYYHKPGDNYEPEWWKLDGMVEDLQLLFDVGYMLSNENKFPNWYEGNEFKAKRDEQMESVFDK
ncbi:MAG: peptidase M28 [Ignavibacteria bacterium GWA2_35_9]|nr:MAG: peptidase M28 [Ignavibacteria bacterium GWA2_35_9]OGU44288.1 MAG: peptidase M28 [Ignavibacteria bacterium GWB2_36_8]OGU50752.1 MAG: peptidase M28 [Ignavibacteria bacterium GWC2_36_12]